MDILQAVEGQKCYLGAFCIQNTHPYVKKMCFSALSDGLLFFWITFAGSAVPSHTELGADCKRTPCSSAVVLLRLCAGYTQHLLPRPPGTAFPAACGCAEPVCFITALRL